LAANRFKTKLKSTGDAKTSQQAPQTIIPFLPASFGMAEGRLDVVDFTVCAQTEHFA
jgi:hypothetical protein